MKHFYSPLKSLLSLFFILFALSVNAADYFWIGGSGTWSDLNHWATSSGGSTVHSSLPGETDNVIFDANSFSADGQTVTVDGNIIRVNDFIATNVSYNVDFSGESPIPDIEIYGSLDAPANISFELPSVLLDFNSNVDGQTVNIASGLLNTSEDASVRFSGEGSWSIENGLSGHSLFVTQGEIIFGANTFNFKNVYLWYSFDKTLNLTDATLNIEKWTMNNADFVTVISTNSTINFSDEFQGYGKTYGTVNVTTPTGFGNDIVISGNNTFQNFTVVKGANLLVDANTTQTILGNLTFNGTSSEVVTFESSIEGQNFNFDGTGINISGEYVNISGADFLGTANFSLENSLTLDDSEGWEINSVPTPTGNGQFYYSRIFSDSVYLGLTAGDGMERIVFMREGTYPDVTVADDTEYTADATFGQGQLVGTDTYVVYQGNEKQIKIDGLQPNTEYYFTRMEVNSTPDNSSIKYQNTSTSFAKSAITLESGKIYMQNGSASVNTGDSFYDDGGAGFYFPNRSQVLTLNSAEAGKSVKLTFNELEVRSYEELKIFDGADTTSNLLQSFSGSSHTLPLTVTSSGESLTVKFESDNFETSGFSSDGWQADVEVLLVAPTQKANDVQITEVSDVSINFQFNSGNGDKRLILASNSSTSYSFTPIDDVEYTANSEFSLGQEVTSGVFVVGSSDISELNLTGLSADSQYTIRIFEYNEQGASISYSNDFYEVNITNSYNMPSDNFDEVSLYAKDYVLNSRSTSSLTIQGLTISPYEVSIAEETGVLLIGSKNPINKEEVLNQISNGTDVMINTSFGMGEELIPGVFAISKARYNTKINNLTPNTEYYLAAIVIRENPLGITYGKNTYLALKPVYTLESGILLGDGTTTIKNQTNLYDQTGFLGYLFNSFDNTVTYYPENPQEKLALKVNYSLTRFNGADLIIYDGESTEDPILAELDNWSSGPLYGARIDSIIASNSKGALTIKYKGSSMVYDYYNKMGFDFTIYPVSNTQNAPVEPASELSVSNISEKTASFSWQKGSGENAIAVITQGNNEVIRPRNGFDYEVVDDLTDPKALNNFVIYKGEASGFTYNKLNPGNIYKITIYEYNGEGSEISYGKGTSVNFKTSASPIEAASGLDFSLEGDRAVTLKWKNGNGQKRLVIVSDNPWLNLEGNYFYNKSFKAANGGDLSDLEKFESFSNHDLFIAYNGVADSVSIEGLSGRTYSYRVIEYTETVSGIETYNVSKYKTFSGNPYLGYDEVTSATLNNITATSVDISAVPGDEDYLIVISPTDDVSVPFEKGFKLDNFDYSYGSGVYTRLYDNKVVKVSNNSDFSIERLKPNINYTIAFYPASTNRLLVNYDDSKPLIKTFQTEDVVDFYYVNNTGNWDDKENWSITSGGATTHGSLPGKSSNVIFDENSFASEDSTETKVVSLQEDTYNLYSFEIQDVKCNVHIYRLGTPSNFSIASVIDLGQRGSLSVGTLELKQINETNSINFANGNISELLFLPSNEITNIYNLPFIRAFEAQSSKLYFQLDRDLENYHFSVENSEIHGMSGIKNSITIDAKGIEIPKVIASNATDYFRIYNSVRIDSLVLNHKTLQIYDQTIFETISIENQGNTLTINGAAGGSYIKSLVDTFRLEKAVIKNVQATGDNYHIAKNSIGMGNVTGWHFENDSVPELQTTTEIYANKLLKNSLGVTAPTQSLLEGRIASIRKEGDSVISPLSTELPKISTYNDSLGSEQFVFLQYYENNFQVKGLAPNTNYIIRLYDYLSSGDSILYAEPDSIQLRTLREQDILMSSEKRTVKVTDNNLYSENGDGTAYPWHYNIVSLSPNNQEMKVAFEIEVGEWIPKRQYKLNIYDGADITDPLLYSGGFDSDDIARNTFVASNQEGNLTVELVPDNWGGYIRDEALKFHVYETYFDKAAEPQLQVDSLRILERTSETAKVVWQKGDGEYTLIIATENNFSYNLTEQQFDRKYFNANDILGLGDQISKGFVVYNGADSSFLLKGLKPETNYQLIAISYNLEEGKAPNYLLDDLEELTFYTNPTPPTIAPSGFDLIERTYDFVEFTFDKNEGDGVLVLLKEGLESIDLDSIDKHLLESKHGNSSYFNSLDGIGDGSKVLLYTEIDSVQLIVNNLLENTTYQYAVLNYNINNDLTSFNNNALTGQFITMDGSFVINSFELDESNQAVDSVCVEAEFIANFSYIGTAESNILPIPYFSSNRDMTNKVQLPYDSVSDNEYKLHLPEDIEAGTYFFAILKENPGEYELYTDSLKLFEVEISEISREGDVLFTTTTNEFTWYRNDQAIQDSGQSLELQQAGDYYLINYAGGCAYSSNHIQVKTRYDLQADTIQQCVEDLDVNVHFEIDFGNFDQSFTYYALLLDNSGNEQSLELDTIDLNENYFGFSLPEGLPTNYYSIILKAEGDSIESDTAALYIKNLEPAVITLTENGLTSNYEEGNQWLLDGEPINGATSQTIGIERSGVYSVEVSTEFCTIQSEGVTLTSNRKGLSAVGFRAYPNPVRNDLSLKYTGDEYLGLSSVVVTDLTGKTVYNGLHDFQRANKLEIPLNEISSGVYFITVETKNFRAQQKLIKK